MTMISPHFGSITVSKRAKCSDSDWHAEELNQNHQELIQRLETQNIDIELDSGRGGGDVEMFCFHVIDRTTGQVSPALQSCYQGIESLVQTLQSLLDVNERITQSGILERGSTTIAEALAVLNGTAKTVVH